MAKKNGREIQFEIKQFDSMTKEEVDQFVALVTKGGEVEPAGLIERIKEAYLLALAKDDGRMIAIAALKHPSPAHIQKLALLTRFDGVKNTQAELGWLYVEERARGSHLASRMSDGLCSTYGNSIFATTRSDNIHMQKILEKCGFRKVGNEFPSRQNPGKTIQVWVILRKRGVPIT